MRIRYDSHGCCLMLVFFILLCVFFVSVEAIEFREKPSNVSVLIGQDALFRCSVETPTDGTQLQAQWKVPDGSLLGFFGAGRLAADGGRYSYVKDTADALHLRISRVLLTDDGNFECQMRVGTVPLRSAAQLTVLVAPTHSGFVNYRAGSSLEVKENTTLNVTCETANAKPEAILSWFANGKRIDAEKKWTVENINKTFTSRSSLVFHVSKSDHNKVLTCESHHAETQTAFRSNLTLNVLYASQAPKIATTPAVDELRAGENVTMFCVSEGGNPPPNVSWFRDDRLVDPVFRYDYDTQKTENRYSIIVDASDDGAIYECRSHNAIGEPSIATLPLRVRYAPSTVSIVGGKALREGQAISLQCISKSANPPATLRWLINGRAVPAESGDGDDPRRRTSNVTVSGTDAGDGESTINVECHAENALGSTSTSHVLSILRRPGSPVLFGLHEVHAVEGQSLNATCESRGGNPLASLAWFISSQKNVKTRVKLRWKELRNAQESVEGDRATSAISVKLDRTMNGQQLRCEADNAALLQPLAVSHTINVFFAPRRVQLTYSRDGSSLRAGHTADIACVVSSSNPMPTIVWNLQMPGEKKPQVLKAVRVSNRTSVPNNGVELTSTVQLMPSRAMDGAQLSCVAMNALWPSASHSDNATLSVHYAPESLVTGAITVVVSEGDGFRENISVRANPPVSAWRWTKEGQREREPLKDGGRVSAHGPVIEGKALTPDDAGTYVLHAYNGIGTRDIQLVLIVEYAARVKSLTTPVYIGVDEELTLECEAEGEPVKSGMIRWQRGDTVLPITVRGETRAIYRTRATANSGGVYTCIADNGLGKANWSHALVLVRQAPVLDSSRALDRAAGPINGIARARCRVTAVPNVQFQWTSLGQNNFHNHSAPAHAFSVVKINESTFESVLPITVHSALDYGKRVMCRAWNDLGNTTGSVLLVRPTSPETPTDLRGYVSDERVVRIAWVPGFDGGSDLRFQMRYHEQGQPGDTRIVNTSATELDLTGLEPGVKYEVQVRAMNSHGWSQFSQPPLLLAIADASGIDVKQGGALGGEPLPLTLIAIFVLVAAVLLFVNCCFLCYLHRRQRKKKIHEGTRSARGDVHSAFPVFGVQAMHSPRCDSVNTHCPSDVDDSQSQKTVIEVNPDGSVQRVDDYLVCYEENPQYYNSPSAFRAHNGRYNTTYANYEERMMDDDVFSPEADRRRQLSSSLLRSGAMAPSSSNNNNNGSPSTTHALRTFFGTSGGVHTGYGSCVAGDLV